MSSHFRKSVFVWLPYIFLLIIFLIELFTILTYNDGTFVYSLDDPYIHLRLAQNIVRGTYGINLGDPASPSSSILWPFVLAPFALLGAEQYVPLVLNLIISLGIIAINGHLFDLILGHNLKDRPEIKAFLVVIILIATNTIGLIFTGMEHLLQILLGLILLAGLIEECQSHEVKKWLVLVIILGPLVRYENLALSLPAILYLVFRKQFRSAIFVGGLIFVLLGGFSFYLHSLGLPWLPASIMVKSSVVGDQGLIFGLLFNFFHNIFSVREGVLVIIGFLSFLYGALFYPAATADKLISAWGAVAAAFHLLAGSFGWLFRYEIYIWAVIILGNAYIYRQNLIRFITNNSTIKVTLFVSVSLGLLCTNFISATLSTPLASSNIYKQQYQMRRFVLEYLKQPVGVNDIGWISYQNPYYVLDYYGLASYGSPEYLERKVDSQWMETLAQKHDVRLVMIYEDVFSGQIPADWVVLGKLYLRDLKISPAESAVTFYATSPGDVSQLQLLLEQFTPTLPSGAEFVFSQNG
jgi:hypothetical protein